MCPGYYWIDPNLASPADGIQVYCTKPGCSCLECDLPPATPKRWQRMSGDYFTEYDDGYEVREAAIVKVCV